MAISATCVFVVLLFSNLEQFTTGNQVSDDGDSGHINAAQLRKEILAEVKEEIKSEVRNQIKSILKDEIESARHGFVKQNKDFENSDDLSMSSLINGIVQMELKNGLYERVLNEAKAACKNVIFGVDKSVSTEDHAKLSKGGAVSHNQHIQTDRTLNTKGIFHAIAKRKMQQRYVGSEHNVIEGHSNLGPRAVTQVAFSVYLDRILDHIPEHQTIKFNKIDLNEGNFYNNYTGTFTAPISGIYMFHFEFIGWSRTTELRLMVDDKVAAMTLADHEANSTFNVKGSSTTIVKVNSGQSVWVQSYAVSDGNIIGQNSDRTSTFIGVLLF